MHHRSILIVDEDDARRRAVAQGLAARGQRYLDVGDAFAAMAALGRADFGAVVACEGRRMLSLRSLCQLAKKRHPQILILVLPKEGTDEDTIKKALELPFEMLDHAIRPEPLANLLIDRIDGIGDQTNPGTPVEKSSSIPSFNPFEMPSTEDANGVFDSIPRVDIPNLGAPLLLGGSLGTDEKTEPMPKATRPASASPSTAPAPITLPAPVALPTPVAVEPDEATRPNAVAPSPSTTQQEVALDGHFDDVEGGAGAALLMGLFAQDMTGRLSVEAGDAQGTLYLYRGEPVWADDPQGDAGLYRKLVQKKFMKPDDAVDAVAEGALLGSLMQAGRLTGQQMHDFMREVVRDRVLALAVQTTGTYRFAEDRAFLDTAPLLKVNPFGLIIDSRRRRLPPPALMALGQEIEKKFIVPLPALQSASEKLAPFCRGANAYDAIDGTGTVQDFLNKVGLDPFMGSLVVAVMRDCKLVSLEDEARARSLDLSQDAFAELSGELTIADTETPVEEAATAEEAQAREDIFSLYMRLKPLSQPRQVLGIGVEADEAAVDAAYKQRMVELDPKRIPEGSAQHLLSQRIEELRRKVTSAYQTLKMQVSSSGGSSSNPF